MGNSAEHLTARELAAAVHAIERAAGQAAFSPGYQNAIGEILRKAEEADLLRPEHRVALERRIRDGLPEPGSADARIRGAEDVYGLSVLDAFLRARDRTRPLLVVTWTTDFLDRLNQPVVSTPDLVREPLTKEDRGLAEALAPVLQTVQENIHFHGTPEEMAELEPVILRQLVALFRATSRDGDRLRVHDLTKGGLDALRRLAGETPVDAILIPSIQDASPAPPSFRDFAVGVVGPAGDPSLEYAAAEVGPAVTSTALPPGSRMLWFGYQADHWGAESRPLRVAARRRTLETSEAIDVVHFPESGGEDFFRCVPLGGHMLFLAWIGPGRCALRVERARSWVDWFVRVRPERTWRGEHPADSFVAVAPDEEELPWRYELFSPQGRAFRRQFLPFGTWVRLGTLGSFDLVRSGDGGNLGQWRVKRQEGGAEDEEEADASWKPGMAADSNVVRVPALEPDDISAVRSGTFDPGAAATSYPLYATDRDEWQQYLLNEGDLVFGPASLKDAALPSLFAQVTGAAVGTIGAVEDGISRFVFDDGAPAQVRRWTVAFLQSMLADQWVRALQYEELEDEFGLEEVLPDLLIPLPDSHWLNAYAEAETAERRLEESERAIARLRAQLFEPDSEGRAGWDRLQNISARATAVNALLGTTVDAELTVRFLHPYPLADGLRRIRITADPEKRLRRVAELGELTAGIVVGFWVILARARPGGLPTAVATMLRERLRRRLTFGGLLQLIQEHLIPSYEQSPLRPYLARPAVEAADQHLRHLNSLRNDLSHNRIPDAMAAGAVLPQAEEAAMGALASLESLAILQLVRVYDVDADAVSGRCRRFSGRALAGDHPAGLPVEAAPSEPTMIFPGHLYLRTPEGSMLPATPMFSLDPEAPEIGLGVIDRITSEGVEYRRPGTSRTWTDSNALEHLPG